MAIDTGIDVAIDIGNVLGIGARKGRVDLASNQ
jgi:hypothetical protein